MNKIENSIKTISDIYSEYLLSETDTVNLKPYDEALLEVHTVLEQERQAQAERDNPQPLTLEQLKERVGKPVYIVEFIIDFDNEKEIIDRHWVISYLPPNETYGKTWLAYDYEPKENETPL